MMNETVFTKALSSVRNLLHHHFQTFRMSTKDLSRLPSGGRYRNGAYLPEVVYKSDNFLCVNKGFDIKINFDDPTELTLEHQVRSMFPELVDSNVAHSFRYAHRLDYATSGILCLALNRKAAAQLSNKFKNKQVTKYYLALVRGHLEDESVFVDVPTGHLIDEDWPGRRCVSTDPRCDTPQNTQTLLICLERGLYDGKPASKVLLKPLTGRQHQLRVHCDYIGHTIVGDYTYSLRQDTEPERMMLHSYRLVANMNIDDLDLTTTDPFTPELIKEWVPQNVVHTYLEAESLGNKFDQFMPNLKTVQINESDT